MKIVLAVPVLALALAACSDGRTAAALPPDAPPPGQVKLREQPGFIQVAPVQVSTEGGAVTATGKVTFDEARVSRVGAPVSGRVVALLAQPGDRVRKGQPLLAIASPDAESAIADLVAARADAAVARKTLDRVRRLYADQAVPYKDVLQAESDETKATAALARAKGRVEVLGIDPAAKGGQGAHYLLRAPLDGIVVDRAAFPGMEVRADTGAPLATVADLSRLWVLADVYERDLALVANGERAQVRVAAWPGKVFEGTVTHVGEVIDPQSHTVKLRIAVENPRLELKPEMFARVTLQGGAAAPAITVPSAAVITDGEASAVVVALGDGRFEKRTIESGPEQDGRIRVLSGLARGERVVVDGALYLQAAIDGR